MRRVVKAAIALVLSSVPASGQTLSVWSAASGIEQFSLRDIVRSGPPVDASPITWEGTGPALVIGRERTSAARRHALDVSVARAGGFEYQSPLASHSAPSNDSAFRIEGRYEYDRRILSRHLPAWAEAAVGVRGSGEYVELTHHVDPSWDIGLTTRSAAAAIVVSGMFGRGRRVRGDVRYGNAAVFGWLRPHGDTSGASGGGWTTDLEAGVALRTSATLSVTTRILTRGDTFLSSHRGYSTSRPRLTVGVLYAR